MRARRGPGRAAPGRLLHPLCGSNPATLVAALARNGFVGPSRLPQASLALAAALGRWPFSAAERAWVAARRRRRPPMPAPLFIVGHLRSGTTHLQNVLSRSPRFGRVTPVALGLPWDLLALTAIATDPTARRAGLQALLTRCP